MGDDALIEMHRFLNRARQLEPAWYPVSIAVEAIPCVWFGGRLAAGVRSR
jgi:hypothetical protein